MASIRGHFVIVQLFVERGIDINKTNIYGQNALDIASFKGNLEIVQFLREKGIDIIKNK